METTKEIEKLALDFAAKSPCTKRKVGAIILDENNEFICGGFNHNGSCECEDLYGNTHPEVIHAEVAAIEQLKNYPLVPATTIYVTHEPCDNCAKAIKAAGIKNVIIVGKFMKFDTGKLRYGLIPPSATKALAQVLTYGAKKYKPNNWQEVDDTTRYIDALYRHLEAWRSGEKLDEESGLSHLAHALTNVAFLLHLDDEITSK